MKIVDCPWELENLGCRVAEISTIEDEVIDPSKLVDIESKYDYIVVKIPQLDFSNSKVLSQNGYSFIESQISVEKKIKDVDVTTNKAVAAYYKRFRSERITEEKDLSVLLDNITSEMFHTDRIFIDPEFGPKYSERRYKNWIKTEFKKGALVYNHYYRETNIGFSLCKIENNIAHGLLAGVFEKYQNSGMGLFLGFYPILYTQYGADLFVGKSSSNNMHILRIYQRFLYDLVNIEYVYIKHINH